ncbi:ATP/GTP-binding protein [Granulicella sp. S156]|uniref:AAA family ATPase n=1 Tax=Granulicella sp. S156 TaxID=1747224 RepID=UPI00131E5CF8|nr:ATP-binding protein [Granulicella sp. S156]
MILSFAVENYRSILKRQELTFLASRYGAFSDSLGHHPGVKNGVLPVIALFGANAAGKTSMLKAFAFFSGAVRNSHAALRDTKIQIRPHFFRTSEPTMMECEFILDRAIYKIGFRIDADRVIEEWLYLGRRLLYRRHGQNFQIGTAFKGGKALVGFTRPNALFISSGAANNNQLLGKLQNAIDSWTVVSDDNPFQNAVASVFMDHEYNRRFFLQALRVIDPLVSDIRHSEEAGKLPFELPPDMQDSFGEILRGSNRFNKIKVTHQSLDGNNAAELTLDEESAGTKNYLGLLGLIMFTLESGTCLFLDEMDASLHTGLLKSIIMLFQSPKTNPRHAQLFFTTHDTALLDSKVLRPDEIWFADKDPEFGTKIYSLADFEGMRSSMKSQRDYLEGRFGAIPFMEDHLQVVAEALAGERAYEQHKEETK